MTPPHSIQSRRSPSSSLGRSAEVITSGLGTLLAVWTLFVAVCWVWRIGGAEIEQAVRHPGLKAVLVWLASGLDVTWIAFGAVTVYLSLAKTEGIATVRRWTLMIVGGAFLLAALSATTRFPLGPIAFTDRLGTRIGSVPFGVPLLWLILILGGRELVLRVLPKVSHVQLALGTGVLGLLSIINIEAIVRSERAWWLWTEGRLPMAAPLHSFAVWFLFSCTVTYFLREDRTSPALQRPGAPAAAWLSINSVCLLVHIVRLVSR